MATLRNKRKLAAVSRETEESPRNSQSQNTSVPGITEDYITQVSEEIEGRSPKNCLRISGGQITRFGCSVQIRRTSLEAASTDTLQNRFRNIPQQWHGKPGTSKGSFPEWSLSRSGILCLLVQQFEWLWPERDLAEMPLKLLSTTLGSLKVTKQALLIGFLLKASWIFLNNIIRCLSFSLSLSLSFGLAWKLMRFRFFFKKKIIF